MAVQGGSQVLLPPTPAEIPPGAIFEMLKNKMNTGLSGHGQRMGRGHPLDNVRPLGDLPGGVPGITRDLRPPPPTPPCSTSGPTASLEPHKPLICIATIYILTLTICLGRRCTASTWTPT